MKARIRITLKNGVLDPQGKAIQGALSALGFAGVDHVRQGKYIELDIAAPDRAAAETQVRAMCEKLLANTVIENYSIAIDGE
jgi:phosphoribosylformylglycinamidine synthase